MDHDRVQRSADVVLENERRGGGARRHADLAEDVAEVSAHRMFADDQAGGDVPVRQAAGDESEYFDPARPVDKTVGDARWAIDLAAAAIAAVDAAFASLQQI